MAKGEAQLDIIAKDMASTAFDKVARSAKQAGDDIEKGADRGRKGLENYGESAGDAASTSSQVAGAFGDIGGSLSAMGFISDGAASKMDTFGMVIMGATGVFDLAEAGLARLKLATIAQGIASKVTAAASYALGAAVRFATGPFGIIIGVIALMAVGLVVAYKKSETFRNIVNGAFAAVKATVGAVAGFFVSVVPGAFAKITSAASSVFSWVKGHWPLLLAILTGPIGLATLAIVKNWDKIKSGATSVKDAIVGGFRAVVTYISTVPGKILALGKDFKDAGSSLMHKIIDGIKGAAGFIGDIASGIWNAVKGMINQGIDKINAALEFSIKVGPKTFHINPPNIPHLAKGGIVTSPTVALIGEAGPEAVVPLSKLASTTPGIDEARLASLMRAAFMEALEATGIQVDGKLSGTDIVLATRRTLVKTGKRDVFA